MNNPFENRVLALNGPTSDIVPVTPDDAADLPSVVVALYAETGGDIVFISAAGQTRTVTVGDFSILPVGVRRVLASGTTASGIHGFAVS